MSGRREALLGRFRSGTLERIRRISAHLDDLEQGRFDPLKVQAIARELHTLKGESRMLGLTKISAVAHSTEELLLTAQRTQAAPSSEERMLVRHALEAVSRSLRGEVPGEGSGGAALEAMIDQIGETTSKLVSNLAAATSRIAAPAGKAKAVGEFGSPPAQAAAALMPDEPTHQRPSRRKMRRAERIGRTGDTGGLLGRRRAGGAAGRVGLVLGSAERRPGAREQWVRVSASQLTDVSELCATLAKDFRALRARLRGRGTESFTLPPPEPSTTEGDAWTGDEPTLTGGSLNDHLSRCASALDSLVAQAWALRLVPVEPMLGELAEHALEVAAAQRKKVKVVIEGADLKLERRLLDQLWEPLVHLVRNAIDHGIEPTDQRGDKPAEALLGIRAESTGEHIVLAVSDDGRGIRADSVRAAAVRCGLLGAADAEALDDSETLKLVFHHGFTTRAQAGDWSGRGVGLDVVRTIAHELGGSVGLDTDPGYGTTFSLHLPAMLTKDRVVVIDFGGQLFGVPSRHVQRFTRLDRDEAMLPTLQTDSDAEPVPLLSWNKFLGRVSRAEDEWAIVLEAAGLVWAIGLTRPPFETELLLRPSPAVAPPARSAKAAPPSSGEQSAAPWLPPISAQGILEDGRMVHLLGIVDLATRCRQLSQKPI